MIKAKSIFISSIGCIDADDMDKHIQEKLDEKLEELSGLEITLITESKYNEDTIHYTIFYRANIFTEAFKARGKVYQ